MAVSSMAWARIRTSSWPRPRLICRRSTSCTRKSSGSTRKCDAQGGASGWLAQLAPLPVGIGAIHHGLHHAVAVELDVHHRVPYFLLFVAIQPDIAFDAGVMHHIIGATKAGEDALLGVVLQRDAGKFLAGQHLLEREQA